MSDSFLPSFLILWAGFRDDVCDYDGTAFCAQVLSNGVISWHYDISPVESDIVPLSAFKRDDSLTPRIDSREIYSAHGVWLTCSNPVSL